MKTCENCERQYRGKTYSAGRCGPCYRRQLRISRGLPVARDMDVTERIRAKVAVDGNGCHVFGGGLSAGYGKISLGGPDSRTAYVHRVMYEATRGPIPRDLHIDHLCRNRACCNPDHLEAVTQAENNRRAARAHLSPMRGVTKFGGSAINPWRAEISIDGRNVHLGLFPTVEAALKARADAEVARDSRHNATPERRAEIEAEMAGGASA